MTKLLKVHGSQNSFFILDQTELENPLTDNELRQLTQTLTDHKTGLLGGADGILSVEESRHPGALGKMRVINTDGSEASMCGNGLRTVARYLHEKTGESQFKVETMYASGFVAGTAAADNANNYAVDVVTSASHAPAPKLEATFHKFSPGHKISYMKIYTLPFLAAGTFFLTKTC